MKYSICITSYNRVNELKRLLESIDCTRHQDEVEIIISEDKSPKRDEIKKVVDMYCSKSPYNVIYNSNDVNLGYDRNLGKLKSLASGRFIIFMSDDDMFVKGVLDDYLDYLEQQDCVFCFQPFRINNKICRKYNGNNFFSPDVTITANHIYDSILFSGLTYRYDMIKDLDSERFLNTYYFQVYMFMTISLCHGFHYFDKILVDCVGDGENAYGISESSVKINELANRKSVFSNIEFNKGLLKVISIVDKENNTNCKSIFSKEYSLRTLPGMIKARESSKADYLEYINRLESLDINLSQVYYIYKFSLNLFGVRLTKLMFHIPKSVLLRIRNGANS